MIKCSYRDEKRSTQCEIKPQWEIEISLVQGEYSYSCDIHLPTFTNKGLGPKINIRRISYES